MRRDFTAAGQDRLWVADMTYGRTFVGWVYCAFILDVFTRRVVGWQLRTSLRTDLALDALEMGLWTRERDGDDTSDLVHHSDRGVQYLAIRYSERLAEAGAVASVGSKGDSYDNAMAEAFNSLFKAELVRNKGPWRCIDDLEIAVAEYIDWFNHRRLHGEIGLVPPVELEAHHNITTPTGYATAAVAWCVGIAIVGYVGPGKVQQASVTATNSRQLACAASCVASVNPLSPRRRRAACSIRATSGWERSGRPRTPSLAASSRVACSYCWFRSARSAIPTST